MFEREQAMRNAIANDFDIRNVEYYKDCALPFRDPSHQSGQQWNRLRDRGLEERDIEFLQWVMKVDPRERPTAQAILTSEWFEGEDVPLEFDTFSPDYQQAQRNTEKAMRNADMDVNDIPPEAIVENGHRPGESTASTAAPQSIELPKIQMPIFSTPGNGQPFTPTGSGGFDALLDRREQSSSPIKEHPLVQRVMSQGEEDTHDTVHGGNVHDGGDEEEEEGVAQPGASREQVAVDSGTVAEDSSMTDSSAPTERPSYLGRNSSAGGTYLSYR